MRKTLFLLPVLALAGCGETLGWNPNYGFTGSAYGNYQREREAALMGLGTKPDTVPVSRPFAAPTAADLAGNPWAATRANSDLPRATAPAAVTVVAAPAATVAVVRPAPGSASVLVSYAAANGHKPGTRVWPRSTSSTAAASVCARFPTPADAQLAFLRAGGPQSDPLNLDPDGDGYVCGWDPAPLRPAR